MNSVAWPPNYFDEKIRRIRLNERLRSDGRAQALAVTYYKTHPIEWIEDWCVTYDPRLPQDRLMPFLLFDKQREFILFLWDCYLKKENGLCEKARDIGASWLCCAFSVWLWLFHQETTVGWGSRKEEYVDKKGDPKAIFPKIRQIIKRLPKWMQPFGFNENIHSTHMKIINPENGSVITGEAGDNIGRGGRTSMFIKDESAHYERPEMIEAALGDNTDVQIDISSVNGTGNVFHRRRMAGEIWTPGCEMETGITRVFIFDWRDHPGKTQEWYDRRRKKAENEGLLHMFAQEVDRDYAAAVDGIIIPSEWVNAAVDAHLKLGITPEGMKVAMQDVADEGGDKNALTMRHGIVCMYADHWAGEAGEAAKKAVPICNEFGATELYYDSIGVGVGFKTQINTMKEFPSWNNSLLVFSWNAGATPLEPDKPTIPGDRQSPLNKDQYQNLKAQAWFRVRARFYKTFRAVVYGEVFPHEELISLDSRIPMLHQLKMELSQAVKKTSLTGKTMVDKAPDGTKSPNLADAFVAMYNPTRKVSTWDVV